MNIFNLYPLSIILILAGGIFWLAGLIIQRFSPKRINFLYGYRTKRSMKDLESWNFAQFYSGKKMKSISAYMIFLGFFLSFFKVKIIWAIPIGLILVILIPILLIFNVEKQLKKRFSKKNNS
tara:strand:+ start:133 stop:498 length:366 start_codon:yes stop_codon:yes gene_type:complete